MGHCCVSFTAWIKIGHFCIFFILWLYYILFDVSHQQILKFLHIFLIEMLVNTPIIKHEVDLFDKLLLICVKKHLQMKDVWVFQRFNCFI